MISIVTCWLDHPELIPGYEGAIQGARAVIVDQASTPEVAAALDAMAERLGHGSTVIHSPTNLRFAAGNNRGLAEVESGIVVCLNNDVQGPGNPPNRWLEMVARDVRPGGLFGPSRVDFDVDVEKYPYIEGWCVAADHSVWTQLGGWDAVTYPEAYAEDVDLSWRARLGGASLFQTRWPIAHIGNHTNRTLPGAYDHADRQRAVFRERVRAWKATP